MRSGPDGHQHALSQRAMPPTQSRSGVEARGGGLTIVECADPPRTGRGSGSGFIVSQVAVGEECNHYGSKLPPISGNCNGTNGHWDAWYVPNQPYRAIFVDNRTQTD